MYNEHLSVKHYLKTLEETVRQQWTQKALCDYEGANLTIGYYKNPEANAAAFTDDGWFRTGDLGLLDEDNNIFIRGRIKSMILNSSAPPPTSHCLSTVRLTKWYL